MAFKKFTASEDILKPDPRYNSKLVSKFINCLMWQGKKTVGARSSTRPWTRSPRR